MELKEGYQALQYQVQDSTVTQSQSHMRILDLMSEENKHQLQNAF